MKVLIDEKNLMNVLRNTKGIISDDRTYPQAAAEQLFNYLVLPARKEAGLSGHVVDADAFANEFKDYTLETTKSYRTVLQTQNYKGTYKGKLVVLFNEWTQSRAEGTAQKLKDCGATSIGTYIAAANGDVTNFNLPGSVNHTFSGHRTSMQRTGIVPDIKAEPTIKGVRLSKDEVLERAVSYLQSIRK